MKYSPLLFLLMLLQSCGNTEDPFYADLAYRWAPVHYQDTDDSDAKADYLSRFDYDGNWEATDNWDHLGSGDLSAYVYYSIVETSTNWFIVYAFYHPHDWVQFPSLGEHENDMEGYLSVIKKDGTKYGQMMAIITVHHDDFYSYTPRGSALTNTSEDIDGNLQFLFYDNEMHPLTEQGPRGHPLDAWPYVGNFVGAADEDGIIYYPSRDLSEVPSSGNDRSVKYKLIDMNAFGNLWTLQLFESTQIAAKNKTYYSWGTYKGNDTGGCGDYLSYCQENAAHAPWGWDDGDDGPTYTGEMALNPAKLVSLYFNGLGDFDMKYTRNKYLQDLKTQGFSDDLTPIGWSSYLKFSDLYATMVNP